MNTSKARNLCFWKKVRASGGVGDLATSQINARKVLTQPDASSMRDSHVSQGGRIFPWGTIRISRGMSLYRYENSGCVGATRWCEKLVPYGGGNFFAKTVDSEHSGEVVICRKDNGLEVDRIPYKDFLWTVNAWVCIVLSNGYLTVVGDQDSRFPNKESVEKDCAQMITSLDQANRGQMPSMLDNSSFTRVSTDYVGQEVVRIQFRFNQKFAEATVVYTLDGKRLKSVTHCPLAYGRWSPTSRFVYKNELIEI